MLCKQYAASTLKLCDGRRPGRKYVDAGAICRNRPPTAKVQALAMPVSTRQSRSAKKASKALSEDHQAPSDAKARNQHLVLGERETAVHNSFYMPTSTWSDILLVEGSSSPTVTDLGPVCTDKYGM
jgi:hypothetical protein